MQNLVDVSGNYDMRRQRFEICDHFEKGYVDGGQWTKTLTGTGAAVADVTSGVGGQLTLTSGATNNNECYLASTKNIFLPAANKPLHLAARLKFTEAATNASSVAFGLMSAVATGAIVSGGTGLVASYSGVSLFKLKGATTWRAEASVGSTRTGPKGTTTSVLLDANGSLDGITKTSGGGVFQWLEIDVVPFSTTLARVDFMIDGVLVQSIANWTYTSVIAGMLWCGVLAGGANSEVVTLDFLGGTQKL